MDIATAGGRDLARFVAMLLAAAVAGAGAASRNMAVSVLGTAGLVVAALWQLRAGKVNAEPAESAAPTARDDVPAGPDHIACTCGAAFLAAPVLQELGQLAERREVSQTVAACLEPVDAIGTALQSHEGGIDTVGAHLDLARSFTFQILGQNHVLEDLSDQISTTVDAIRGIARQTRLLSLNANIEAARAGDAGRGFSVVADEVRTLSQSTQSATEAIDAVVGELRDLTEAGATMTNGAADELEHSRRLLQRVQGANQSVYGHIHDMRAGVDAANATVDGLFQELARIAGAVQEVVSSIAATPAAPSERQPSQIGRGSS